MSQEASIDRIRTGRSWDGFCDAPKAAGMTDQHPQPRCKVVKLSERL